MEPHAADECHWDIPCPMHPEHVPSQEDEPEYEEEEDEVPRPLKRQNAGMSPLLTQDRLMASLRCSEQWENPEDEAVMAQPDLGEYFGQWEMPPSSEIALCRTYANYLASKLKAVRKTK